MLISRLTGKRLNGMIAHMSVFLNKTIRLFLDSIGRRDEYEYYLERFSADRPRSFAVLVPERDGFEDSAGVFVFDMRFLLRLGLDPVVLLCGPDAESTCKLLQEEDDAPFDVYRVSPGLAEVGFPFLMERLESARQAGRSLVLVDPAITVEAALDRLVPDLTRRIHFIRVRGPLHDKDGQPLYFYQTQVPDGGIELATEDQPLVTLATRLLDAKAGLHISVASPLQLLKELFTVKGAGCVVRRGATIIRYDQLSGLDVSRLVALLETSFGKPLCQRGFLDAASSFYVERDYKGAAILEPFGSLIYLSKFAVQVEARGDGLAQELWRAVTADHHAMFWRSSLRNPINQWYDRQADGSHRSGRWTIYWRGIAAAQIPDVIENALSRSEDFMAAGSTDACL